MLERAKKLCTLDWAATVIGKYSICEPLILTSSSELATMHFGQWMAQWITSKQGCQLRVAYGELSQAFGLLGNGNSTVLHEISHNLTNFVKKIK
jgi:hypothetical protein